MGEPTVHDIAKEAGVSLATVDRVLNSRPGVREKTVDRVREAVERLGYVRDINAANLARQRRYRFVFLLPEGESQFLESLEAAVDEAGSGLIDWRCELEVIRTTFRDPPALAEVERRILPVAVDHVPPVAPPQGSQHRFGQVVRGKYRLLPCGKKTPVLLEPRFHLVVQRLGIVVHLRIGPAENQRLPFIQFRVEGGGLVLQLHALQFVVDEFLEADAPHH